MGDDTLAMDDVLGEVHVENNVQANHDDMHARSIRELTAFDSHFQNIGIDYRELDATSTFELKLGLIHLLPKFSGSPGEDRLFYLPPRVITTWEQMRPLFLEKFFLASRTAIIRNEISRIVQRQGETLHEYWERFKRLLASCPLHRISEELLIQYLYDGLSFVDLNIIDAVASGALSDYTPAAAWALTEKMAQNVQQFSARAAYLVKAMDWYSNVHYETLQHQIHDLTGMMK